MTAAMTAARRPSLPTRAAAAVGLPPTKTMRRFSLPPAAGFESQTFPNLLSLFQPSIRHSGRHLLGNLDCAMHILIYLPLRCSLASTIFGTIRYNSFFLSLAQRRE
jgi:hypothetical protein